MVVGQGYYEGHIVLRTAATYEFEVINLIDPRPDGCWGENGLMVQPLDGPITLEIS